MNRTELISLLNEDLSLAYRSHVQTIGNLAVPPPQGPQPDAVVAVRRDRIARLPLRLERAVELATLIGTLGGRPTTMVSPPHQSPNPRSALVEELVLERLQASRLRKRSAQARELGEAHVAGAIERLASECDHEVDRLEPTVKGEERG